MILGLVRLALLAWLTCAALAAAAGEIELDGHEGTIVLDATADYAEDSSGLLGIDAMAASSVLFRPIGRRELNRGYSSSVHWLRLSATNTSAAAFTRWLEVGNARLQHVSVFEATADGWRETSAGTQVPLAAKPVAAAAAILPITLLPGQHATWFIRVASETAIELNTVLWDPLVFRRHETSYIGLQALILGALVLSGLSAVATRGLIGTRTYLWFGLAQLFYAVNRASANGIVQAYLWPEHWRFASWLPLLLTGAATACLLLFTCSFLDLRRISPRWNKVLLTLAVCEVLEPVGTLFHFRLFAPFSVALAILAFISTLLPIVIAIARGHRAARWLLASQLSICLLVIPYAVSIFGIVTMPAAVETALSLSIILSSALSWFAIANRVNQLQRDREGADTRAIVQLEDAVRERTGELRAALVEAENANRAKTTFLARVSHELRTPLHTVIGYAELLQRGSMRVTPKECAGAIDAGARRLLALIDELLDYVRGESGSLRLNPQPVRWDTFSRRVIAETEQIANGVGNRFIWKMSGWFPAVVHVDEQRLRQVLDNLLVNANRHTSRGIVMLEMDSTLDEARCAARIEFRVRDTGCGIAPEDTERIFEPFVSGSRSTGGMGLGLAISRQLALLMEGTLRLEQSSPEGTTFVLEIVVPSVAEDHMPVRESRPKISDYEGGRRTVVIVEDVEENRRLLENVLLDSGFLVRSAGSGAAVSALLDDNVDLVITDQSMPDGDGWEVLRMVRGGFPRLPVLLLSATPALRPEGFPIDLDFAAVLLKPVDGNTLLENIGRLLGLQWIWAPVASAGGDATAFTFFDRAQVPRAMLDELQRLIELGDVTSIEQWASDLGHNLPGLATLAHQVRRAAEQLDFDVLRQLVER